MIEIFVIGAPPQRTFDDRLPRPFADSQFPIADYRRPCSALSRDSHGVGIAIRRWNFDVDCLSSAILKHRPDAIITNRMTPEQF